MGLLQRSLERARNFVGAGALKHQREIDQIDWYLSQLAPGTVEARFHFQYDADMMTTVTVKIEGVIYGRPINKRPAPDIEGALKGLAHIEDDLR